MRKGVSIIELMMALIIFSIVMTSLYSVYSSSRKGASEIIENHALNERVERTLQRIINDVREANIISEDYPPMLESNEIDSFETDDALNMLEFTKILYDFTLDPSTMASDELNYTQNKIRYFLEQDDDNNLWVLMREMLPYDNRGEPVNSQMTIYPVISGLEKCIFYRVVDPDASRSGNLYVKLKMSRDESSTYTNETLISVRERGSSPP